jgi:hypothetical protein
MIALSYRLRERDKEKKKEPKKKRNNIIYNK